MHKAAGADPVSPGFVFLDLLKGQIFTASKLGLADPAFLPRRAQTHAEMHIQGINSVPVHKITRLPSNELRL